MTKKTKAKENRFPHMADWRYFVIYEFDCERSQSVKQYQPSRPLLRKLDLTEDDSDGDDPDMKHRKYTGLLTHDDFRTLLDDCALYAEDAQTMGMLTVEYGHLPAVSFRGQIGNAWQNMYVCPLPYGAENRQAYENMDWGALFEKVVKAYDGGSSLFEIAQSYRGDWGLMAAPEVQHLAHWQRESEIREVELYNMTVLMSTAEEERLLELAYDREGQENPDPKLYDHLVAVLVDGRLQLYTLDDPAIVNYNGAWMLQADFYRQALVDVPADAAGMFTGLVAIAV